MQEQNQKVVKLFSKRGAKALKQEIDELTNDEELGVSEASAGFAKRFIDMESED